MAPQVSSLEMEQVSSNILPRKRKQFSTSMSLRPCSGPVTRSQCLPGGNGFDAPSPMNLQQQRSVPDSSHKKPKSIHCPILENGASLVLSIKDLRARARRVFSPAARRQNELGFDFQEEFSNGSSKIMENGRDVESGLKNSDLGSGFGSGTGFCASDKEGKETQSIESSIPGSKDLDMGFGYQGPSVKKMNKIHQLESGNECCENIKNGSISSTRMVRKSSSRGKVYSSPSLFSYRRMLPFLADMVKEESGTKWIAEDSIQVDSSASQALTDSKFAQHEQIDEDSNGTRPPDKAPIKKFEVHHEVKVQDLHDAGKGLPQNGTKVNLSDVEGRTQENGITGGDELNEDHIQKTPPDSTILSEMYLHDTDGNAEVINLRTHNSVLGCPSSGRNCSDHDPVLRRSYPGPTRRNNTISTTKLVPDPSTRSKIYTPSGSISYRRLLPYLMDVAKGSSNNDPSPKFQKHMDNSQHSELSVSLDNGMILNRYEACDFQEKKQDKCEELNFPTGINAPSHDGSSDAICPELSTPFFIASNEISLEKPNSACSENFTELEKPNGVELERTSPHKHAQLNNPRKLEGELHDADASDAEVNQLVETLCSSINHRTLPGDFKLEVSAHQPVEIVKNCTADGVHHEGKIDSIQSVILDMNSSKSGGFYFQGTESPTRGILKRNPRGCRGLCNCLNCSSFRLHAERAFEFSRNQMLDAEEVVLMLINELGELRDRLEKSVIDGSDLSAIQLKQLQVEESCKKSLAVEQQAKQRLSQMNEDLNVHCRTTPFQRPRVTFSRYTEVKPIPETELSGSPSP